MRTYTREQVEQVVEGVVREADSAATVPEVSDVDEAYSNGRMDGAREVLRRLDALPNPPAAPESSTKRCASYRCLANYGKLPTRACGFCDSCCGHARGICSDKPPSEDGGLGEPQWKGWLPRMLDQRPRATTPTPEVPALKANRYCPLCGVECASCGHDEPTVPEVAWEGATINGRRLRVMGDGSVRADNNDGTGWREPAAWQLSVEEDALARALAEAKRPPTFDRQKYEDACARLDEAMRLGAESMRERAAKVADTEQEEAEKRRAESVAAGHTQTIVLAEEQSLIATRIADDIRALPLDSEGEVPSTVDADLAAKALTEAVHNAVGMVADECLGMLHRGRVADAIATLTAAKQVTP